MQQKAHIYAETLSLDRPVVSKHLKADTLTPPAGRTDSKRPTCAALPEGPGLQPGQGQGVLVPLAHLEEAAQGGFPVGHVGAAAAAPGLLQRGLAPPRQR